MEEYLPKASPCYMYICHAFMHIYLPRIHSDRYNIALPSGVTVPRPKSPSPSLHPSEHTQINTACKGVSREPIYNNEWWRQC